MQDEHNKGNLRYRRSWHWPFNSQVSDQDPYLFNWTYQNTYRLIGYKGYEGTAYEGMPSLMRLMASNDLGGSNSTSVKVVDRISSLVLFEKTGIDSTDIFNQIEFSDFNVANMPAGPTILELHMKAIGPGGSFATISDLQFI